MFCLSFSISKMQIVVPAPFQAFFKDAQVRSTTPRTCTHTDKEEIHLKFSSRTKEQRTQRNQIIRKGNQLENQHTLDTDENVIQASAGFNRKTHLPLGITPTAQPQALRTQTGLGGTHALVPRSSKAASLPREPQGRISVPAWPLVKITTLLPSALIWHPRCWQCWWPESTSAGTPAQGPPGDICHRKRVFLLFPSTRWSPPSEAGPVQAPDSFLLPRRCSPPAAPPALTSPHLSRAQPTPPGPAGI